MSKGSQNLSVAIEKLIEYTLIFSFWNYFLRNHATYFRVIIPEEELSRKCARQSIVFFVHPDDQVSNILPKRTDKDLRKY